MADRPDALANNTVPRLRFILALFIVKTKPVAWSYPDYITALREHIARGQKRDVASPADDPGERSTFWQQAFEEEQRRAINLQAQITILKHELDASKQVKHAEAEICRAKRKRIVSDSSQSSAAKRSKTVKAAQTSLHSEVEEVAAVNAAKLDPISTAIDPEGNKFLDHIAALRLTMAKPQATSSEIFAELEYLTYATRNLIWTVKTPTAVTVKSHECCEGSDDPIVPQRRMRPTSYRLNQLEMVAQMFPQLLKVIDKLGEDPPYAMLQQSAVYSVHQVLQALLDVICDVARTEAKIPVGVDEEIRASTSNVKSTHAINGSSFDNHMTSRLCYTLLSMVRCLDTGKMAHQAVRDGFLFSLLSKLGMHLSWAAFEELPPSGLQGGFPGRRGRNKETIDFELQAEAPYLICLLSSVLEVSAENPPSGDGTSNKVSNITHLLLRNSLLKACFGTESPEEFEPCLKSPAFPRNLPSFGWTNSNLEPASSKTFVIRELWRLLGWEALHGLP